MARGPFWAFMTRAGSERDLVEELGAGHGADVLAEGLVVSDSRPRAVDGGFTELAFARQAMRIAEGGPAPLHTEELADRVARVMHAHLPRDGEPWTWSLQVVAADSNNPRDPRRRSAADLQGSLPDALRVRLRQDLRVAETGEGKEAQRLVQVWPIDRERALSGLTMIEHALTGTAGGRIRMKRPTNAASRAGLKLEEAIAWIGVGPEKGDLCVDLGAAPGGWSQVAVRRGATVIAVDPAEVKAELPRQWFTQVKLNAFEFAPSETMDWLLCDMAWRPLEVAQLVSKWGRRVWARQFIANFKLPMKKKVEILRKITSALEAAGWRGLRARQLYFDRDEVTIYGWLDPKIVVTGIKPPFQLRSRQGRDKKTREPALTRAKKRPRTKRKRTTKTRQ